MTKPVDLDYLAQRLTECWARIGVVDPASGKPRSHDSFADDPTTVLLAAQSAVDLLAEPILEFLHWLMSLDDPAGMQDRRTTSLDEIVHRARISVTSLRGDG